ncbi:ADP/ATP carrier protein [Apiotrichum porosum]|uniref:ADP/ATP carrier protein n=1 Tax=Apiotrichum porosum TaxID=105984 RepID=A0A427XLT5_9TREE|nr:ADP/ATP carrier protein [Apiotrichum porosum]RSH79820.1 ADP/ATP carrier protein [Apiotrichum porosum]
MSSTKPLTPVGSALAGALGAVFSNAVVYPLDTVKTRLQALPSSELKAETGANQLPGSGEKRKQPKGLVGKLARSIKRNQMLAMLIRIVRTEGVTGVFKGFSASMINTFSMQFAYFFFHTWLRTAALKRATGPLSTPAELGLGALAGAFAQVFTIPVAVVATRQQLWIPPPGATGKATHEPSLWETASEVVSEGGITALWTGLKPGLVLTVNPAITYGVFERAKSWVLAGAREGGKLSVAESFWIGVMSKTLATVVTYPYIFAKVRLQAKKEEPGETGAEHKKHDGAIDILKNVYKEQGFAGWYQGMGAQITKAVLSQGILFVSKDQFEGQARVIMDAADNFRASHPLLQKA